MADSVYFKKISKTDFDKITPDAHTLYIVLNGDYSIYGLFDDNGRLIKSWDELLDEGIIAVNDGVLSCSNKSAINGNLVIKNDVTTIGEQAFSNIPNLHSVNIPNSVTLIRRYAFYNCLNLKSVSMTNSVSQMSYDPFGGTTSISELIFDGTLSEWNYIIKNNFYKNYDYDTFISDILHCLQSYPGLVGGLYDNNGNIVKTWEELKSTVFLLEDNKLLPRDTADIFFGGKLVIPEEVAVCMTDCFKNWINIEEIYMPASYTYYNCFENCDSLQTVTILNTCHKFSNECFKDCNFYTIGPKNSGSSFEYPSNIHNLGYGAFTNCQLLRQAILSDEITIVSEKLFYGCDRLNYVLLGTGIKIIDPKAFLGTFVQTLRYSGTQQQWRQITLSENWNLLKDDGAGSKEYISKVICSDGEIIYNAYSGIEVS